MHEIEKFGLQLECSPLGAIWYTITPGSWDTHNSGVLKSEVHEWSHTKNLKIL